MTIQRRTRSRMLPAVGVAILGAGALLIGRNLTTLPIPSASENVTSRGELLQSLLAQRTAPALGVLLAANGQYPGSIEHIINRSEGIIGADTMLAGITEFRNGSFDVVLAPARIVTTPSQKAPHGLGLAPRAEILYIFDRRGNLLKQIGGRVASDGLNGDSILGFNIGANNRWFIVVSQPDESSFDIASDIYVLRNGITHAVHVRHYLNDLGWPTDASAESDPVLSFAGRGGFSNASANEPGIGPDGTLHPATLKWDESRSAFTGCSLLMRDGEAVYEVVTAKSEAFVPVDM